MIDIYKDLSDGEILDIVMNRFEENLKLEDWGDNPTQMLMDEVDGLFSRIKELEGIIENLVEGSTHYNPETDIEERY